MGRTVGRAGQGAWRRWLSISWAKVLRALRTMRAVPSG